MMYSFWLYDVSNLLWVVYVRGRHYVFLFLLLFFVSHVIHWLFIYIMRLFMIYVLFYVLKSRIYLFFTCIFHICVYVCVECFRNLQVNLVVAAVYTGN